VIFNQYKAVGRKRSPTHHPPEERNMGAIISE